MSTPITIEAHGGASIEVQPGMVYPVLMTVTSEDVTTVTVCLTASQRDQLIAALTHSAGMGEHR